MAVGGGGFVLDRDGDHYLAAGDTERLADYGAPMIEAHVLQEVDDADRIGPAVWHGNPCRIAHQGAHMQPARGGHGRQQAHGATGQVGGGHRIGRALGQQQREEAEAGAKIEHLARRDELQCVRVHGGQLADREALVAIRRVRRLPALAEPGQGIAIERGPGQQRVINAGPHDASEHALEDFHPGQPARREQLFGQQPGHVVVELVGGQPVGQLDPAAALGQAEVVGADYGTGVRGTVLTAVARRIGAQDADEVVVVPAVRARRERVDGLRKRGDEVRVAHRPVASAEICWAARCSPVRSATTCTRSQNSA